MTDWAIAVTPPRWRRWLLAETPHSRMQARLSRAYLSWVAFARNPLAMLGLVIIGLLIFGIEAVVAQAVGGVDLLAPAANAQTFTGGSLVATYAAGMALSLPLMFVPFAALFDGAGFGAAFAQSATAFARNPAPLALFGALSLALLLLGLLTSGLGLLLALPWSAAASYAAWKDIFAVA